MSLEFHRKSAVMEDVAERLREINALVDVQPFFSTDLDGLIGVITGPLKMPAAIVTMDGVTYPEQGARNSRKMDIQVYFVGEAQIGNPGIAEIFDISDIAVELFCPDVATPATTLNINGVDYDPEDTNPISEMAGRTVIQFNIKAWDFRQSR